MSRIFFILSLFGIIYQINYDAFMVVEPKTTLWNHLLDFDLKAKMSIMFEKDK